MMFRYAVVKLNKIFTPVNLCLRYSS